MAAFLGFLLLLVLLSCAEREKRNPFEPGNNVKVPLELSLYPDFQQVRLEWGVQDIEDYLGFNIYRSKDDTTHFVRIAQLPREVRQYTDTDIQPYHWYTYYLTVLGHNIESEPTPFAKTYPGPGETFVLTRFGYSIQRLSYDLLHTLRTYNTQFPPVSWTWDESRNEIWLANGPYRFITRLPLVTGIENFFMNEPFRRPTDVAWDAKQERLFVLDPPSKRVFVLKHLVVVDSIALPDENYFRLQLDDQSRLWVLSEQELREFDPLGDSLYATHFGPDQQGQDITYANGHILALSSDFDSRTSRLLTFDAATGPISSTDLPGTFIVLRQPAGKDYFWMAEYLGSENYRCVKLSANGQRLLELPTVKSIADLQINSFDHSVVIARRYEDAVTLYDSTGREISTRKGIYDPIKIVIR